MDSDEEFIFEERELDQQPEYLPEINILDRVAYGVGVRATQLELQTDPVKRFLVYTNSTAVNFSTNKLLPGLNRYDVEEINKKAEEVRHPRYKNPLGFVLGYYIIKDGGNGINVGHLKYVREHSDILSSDRPIKMEDVLRYGRLWLTQL
jgi:hypothetical protein